MCQPEWEGGLQENECMYMPGWVPLLFTWNHHNIVNGYTPRQNKKFKAWGKKRIKKKKLANFKWYIFYHNLRKRIEQSQQVLIFSLFFLFFLNEVSWFWEQGSCLPVAQTLMKRTDGRAVITPCDVRFAGGQPRAWGAQSVPGMYVCGGGGCGCGCVHIHMPLRSPWNGGGVRGHCLQGGSSAHAMRTWGSDDRAQQGSSYPCCPPLPDPPQTNLSGSSCLPLPTGSIRKRTLKTQKREEPLWKEWCRAGDQRHCPLCSELPCWKLHLKPLKLWGCLLQHLYGLLQSSRGLNYLK